MCGDAETLALACQSYMHASLVWKAGHLPGPGSGACLPGEMSLVLLWKVRP